VRTYRHTQAGNCFRKKANGITIGITNVAEVKTTGRIRVEYGRIVTLPGYHKEEFMESKRYVTIGLPDDVFMSDKWEQI